MFVARTAAHKNLMTHLEANEESPLLTGSPSSSSSYSGDPELVKHELLYQRFSPEQKRAIVAVIAWAGLIPCRILSDN